MRVLRQLRRCAQRNSEVYGKRFASDVKVPATHMQVLAGYAGTQRREM